MKPDNIQELLDKYWEGETSIEQELVLQKYFSSDQIEEAHLPYADLFGFFSQQRGITYTQPDLTNETKVVQLKTHGFFLYFTKAAAVLVLALGALLVFNWYKSEIVQRPSLVTYEIEDPDEAYLYTMQALAMVSNTLNESTAPVESHLKVLEKVAIFK